MQTKIKLNLPELSPDVTSAKVVIYNESRQIHKSWEFQGNTTFMVDIPMDTIEWFNVWTLVNNKWSIILGGVPEIIALDTGELFLELNDRPQVVPTVVTKTAQVTQADADFVNGVLGDQVVSPTTPTLPQMAKSLGSSVAGWAKAGFAMASIETVDARLAICKACDLWDQTGFGGTGRCSKCGCSTQAKLRMATSSCPLNPPKWSAQQ